MPSASTERISLPDHALDLRDAPGPAGAGGGHRPSDEIRPQPGGGPVERVALGHGRVGPRQRRVSVAGDRGRAEREAAVAGNEARVEERGPERGLGHGQPVDLGHDELTEAAVGDEHGQGAQRRRGDRRVVGG